MDEKTVAVNACVVCHRILILTIGIAFRPLSALKYSFTLLPQSQLTVNSIILTESIINEYF